MRVAAIFDPTNMGAGIVVDFADLISVFPFLTDLRARLESEIADYRIAAYSVDYSGMLTLSSPQAC